MSIIGFLGMFVGMWVAWLGIYFFRRAESDPDLDSDDYVWYARITAQLTGVVIVAVAIGIMWVCMRQIAQ